jgi:hypothetical protein
MQYTQIVQFFKDKGQKITYRQVYYACKTRATPTKRTGRPPQITTSQTDEIIKFISRSKTNRRMPYWRLMIELGFARIGEYAIRLALRRARYKRYVTL